MIQKITVLSALQFFQLLRFSTFMLIGIVFAKSGLSQADIGLYETVILVSGAVSFFWLNGLIQSFLPMQPASEVSHRSDRLFNVFYLLSVLTLIAIFFLLIFNRSFAGAILQKSQIPFFKYVVAYLFFSVPSSLVEYIYLLKAKSRALVGYGCISFFLMFTFVTVPSLAGLSIGYSLAGLVISAVVRYIWLLVLLMRYSSPTLNRNFINQHLRLAWPLVLSAFFSGSAQYIDGFIVTARFDEATLAIFRYGAREFPLVMLLANAFSMGMLPEFSNPEKLHENVRRIKENSLRMGTWLFPLSGVMLLVSHWVFPIVFNAGFRESATIFNIYLLLIISRLMFPQVLLTGMKKNSIILQASALEIIVNVASSLWLAHLFGIAGIAYGTLVAYLFEKFYLMMAVYRNFRIHPSEYLPISRHVVYSLFLCLTFVLVEFIIF